jgi:hypothetical protein
LRRRRNMQVKVKDIEAELGNNGIVLYIANNEGEHVGKLRVGQATVEWCRGRTRIGNGRRIPLQRFIDEFLEEL